MVAREPSHLGSAEIDAHEVAAHVNRRLAQLSWRVVAEVETDSRGADRLVLRPFAQDGAVVSAAPALRVGHASLSRDNAIESILAELGARGWARSGERPSPRADVLWCAPA
jgi:hypothetical protein